eukprot:gene14696-19745_t
MGSAVSVQDKKDGIDSDSSASINQYVILKKLPEAIEESIYVHERFPLIVDTTEQAGRFLKYQNGSYINFDDPVQCTASTLNRAVVHAIQHGRTVTLKFNSLDSLLDDDKCNKIFNPVLFPKEIFDRSLFFNEEVWSKLLQTSLGDPEPQDVAISPEFVFIICTSTPYLPPILLNHMHVITVKDTTANSESNNSNANNSIDPAMDQIASLYGANEIIRNSVELVEAAFDGDLEELKSYILKGYHIESTDGRKHTALSEASVQGHLHVVTYLLENGADPNCLNDTGRSPLWRASFNGHIEVVKALLEAGANPEFRDKVSMENAFDVAQVESVRSYLSEWDMNKTIQLMDERKAIILSNLEARIKTSAERELFAKNLLRKELVETAEKGDVEGIKNMLTMIANEAVRSNSKPRITAECRGDNGQSLLSIASQNDYYELALFLLTYWKTFIDPDDDITQPNYELPVEAKVFKTNPNSRDLKGWTCVCIGVFHESKKVLQLLLEHGGDPNIRSSYNKNAWDLAKDELDAAEHVIKSKHDIRQVLIDYDQSTSSGLKKNRIFGNGKVVKIEEGNLYEGLDNDGSAMVMNIEMNKEMNNSNNVLVNEDDKKSKIKKKSSNNNNNEQNGKKNSNNSNSKSKKK